MKLVIQIPCYNEEATLGAVVDDLPRAIPGVDAIEVLVIDDGSTDRTVEVAERAGVRHVLRLGTHRGLAAAFSAGIERALEMGAEVIVGTDGDHQYRGECIPDLVRPILDGQADVVVGARPIGSIPHFSPLKRRLSRAGSAVVRLLSRTSVRDAASGFRAYSAEAALRIVVLDGYTYTLETLIQLRHARMRIASVPIRINEQTRESRLIASTASYLWRSARTLLRCWARYRPHELFALLTFAPLLAAVGLGAAAWVRGGRPGARDLWIGAAALGLAALLLAAGGALARLIATNRRLLEENLYLARRERYRFLQEVRALAGGAGPGGADPPAAETADALARRLLHARMLGQRRNPR